MSGVVRDSPCPHTRPSHTTIINFRSSEYWVSDKEDIVPSKPASPSEYAVTMRIVYNCVAIAVADAQSSNLGTFFFKHPFPLFRRGVVCRVVRVIFPSIQKRVNFSHLNHLDTLPWRSFCGFRFRGSEIVVEVR